MPSHLHIFNKYLTQHFVETGTFKCEGVLLALQAGFQYVDSIEIFKEFYDKATRMVDNPNVKFHLGSSESMLWEVIKDKNYQMTFWLDAHYSGPTPDIFQETTIETGTPMSDVKTPLIKELEIIAQHPLKNHIIMIDDIRCCGTDYFDYITKQDLENAVYKINPNYKIIYEDSWEPKDILVAFVP